MKSVPSGRAHKELWQMVCEGDADLAGFEAELMNRAASDRQVLGTWQHSQVGQLDKDNGKEKCAGVRLIDPLSRFKAISANVSIPPLSKPDMIIFCWRGVICVKYFNKSTCCFTLLPPISLRYGPPPPPPMVWFSRSAALPFPPPHL